MVRLISGTMPIVSRIETLKLRYIWKLWHGGYDNLAVRVLKYKRKYMDTSKVGFAHEVIRICCKLNSPDVCLTIRRPLFFTELKVNYWVILELSAIRQGTLFTEPHKNKRKLISKLIPISHK